MKSVVYRILAGLIFCVLLSITSTRLAADGKWTRKTNMPTARAAPATCVVNRKIYAIGGMIYDGWRAIALSTVEVYSPATNTWTKKLDMPTPRSALSTSVVNGKIYVIGGWNGVELSTMLEYNPKTGTWTRKADMPTARSFLSTSVVDGKIYAIGGEAANSVPLSTVEEYDPVTDTWTKKADMPTPRFTYTSVVNGNIYALGGGLNLDMIFPTLEEYDPVTDTWTRKADMPTPRDCHAISVVNDKIYVIGGVHDWQLPIVPLATVEEYTPGGWPFSVSSEGKLVTTWGEIKRSH